MCAVCAARSGGAANAPRSRDPDRCGPGSAPGVVPQVVGSIPRGKSPHNRRKPDTGNAALFSSECESLLSCSTNRRINNRPGHTPDDRSAPHTPRTLISRHKPLYRSPFSSATSPASERGVYGEAASSTEYRRSASSCLRARTQAECDGWCNTRGAAGESAALAPCC